MSILCFYVMVQDNVAQNKNYHINEVVVMVKWLTYQPKYCLRSTNNSMV